MKYVTLLCLFNMNVFANTLVFVNTSPEELHFQSYFNPFSCINSELTDFYLPSGTKINFEFNDNCSKGDYFSVSSSTSLSPGFYHISSSPWGMTLASELALDNFGWSWAGSTNTNFILNFCHERQQNEHYLCPEY